MFQILSWPSASVPSDAAEMTKAGGERPGHQDRQRHAGRANQQELARASDGAGRVLHVESLVIVAPVTSSRLVAIGAGAWAAVAACLSFGAIAFNGPPSTALGAGPSTALGAGAGAGPGATIGVGSLDPTPRDRRLRRSCGARDRFFVAEAPSRWPYRRSASLPAVAAVSRSFFCGRCARAWCGVPWRSRSHGSRCRTGFDAPWNRTALATSCGHHFSLARGARRRRCRQARPHYLVTPELLGDGDLKIENNYRRGDYHAYVDADLPPHLGRNGRNGLMYSIHAPGLPAMILPAFAVGGYHGVVVFLLLVASSACALAWWLAWRTTGSVSAAWFGWAALTLSAPFLLESYTVFPDGPGAAIVLTGFWALLREGVEGSPSVPSEDGYGCRGCFMAPRAALPWLHTRFAVIAATLGDSFF